MKARRILWSLAACALVLLIALVLYPIRNTGIKALMLLCSGTCGIALIALVPKRSGKIAVTTILAAPILIVAFGSYRATDPTHLRSSYIQNLRSYTNIAYVWGGENRR